MIKKTFCYLTLIAFWLLNFVNADLVLSLDKNQTNVYDTILLTIRLDHNKDIPACQLNIKNLEKFKIVWQTNFTDIQVIDWNITSIFEKKYTLVPKKNGEFVIWPAQLTCWNDKFVSKSADIKISWEKIFIDKISSIWDTDNWENKEEKQNNEEEINNITNELITNDDDTNDKKKDILIYILTWLLAALMVYIVYDKKKKITEKNNIIKNETQENENKNNDDKIPNINSTSFKFEICDYIIDHINIRYWTNMDNLLSEDIISWLEEIWIDPLEMDNIKQIFQLIDKLETEEDNTIIREQLIWLVEWL